METHEASLIPREASRRTRRLRGLSCYPIHHTPHLHATNVHDVLPQRQKTTAAPAGVHPPSFTLSHLLTLRKFTLIQSFSSWALLGPHNSLLWRGHLMYYGTLSGFPGFYPPDASSIHLPVVTVKTVSRRCQESPPLLADMVNQTNRIFFGNCI